MKRDIAWAIFALVLAGVAGLIGHNWGMHTRALASVSHCDEQPLRDGVEWVRSPWGDGRTKARVFIYEKGLP